MIEPYEPKVYYNELPPYAKELNINISLEPEIIFHRDIIVTPQKDIYVISASNWPKKIIDESAFILRPLVSTKIPDDKNKFITRAEFISINPLENAAKKEFEEFNNTEYYSFIYAITNYVAGAQNKHIESLKHLYLKLFNVIPLSVYLS